MIDYNGRRLQCHLTVEEMLAGAGRGQGAGTGNQMAEGREEH